MFSWRSALVVYVALTACFVNANELDDYVNTYDPTYSWDLANTVVGDGYTLYILKLVSQTWLSTNEIDRPVWEHWLRICVPTGYTSDLAAIYINGGSNPLGGAPSSMESFLIDVSVKTGLVFAELNQIPNQPITFVDEDFGRSEDSFLAKTWDVFIRTLDAYRIGRFPMVKATVRAMDAMTEFIGRIHPDRPLRRFGLAGGSKRGWVTWLAGAVDDRVVCVAPVVIEVLHMIESLNFEYQVYGRWPVAFKDYVEMNVTRCLNCPVFNDLAALEDPYYYLERYQRRQVPILSVSATGDEFFLPDGYQFWYFDYPGEKYLGIQPNAEHSMFNRIEELSASLGAYMVSVDKNVPRPEFTWTLSEDGTTIILQTVTQPLIVKVWEATNTRGRSFIANCYLTCLWRSTVLNDRGNGTYVATYDVPETGYRGFFIEIQYEIETSQTPITVTTGTSIIPKTLPYGPCGDKCAQCDTCLPDNKAKLPSYLSKRYQP